MKQFLAALLVGFLAMLSACAQKGDDVTQNALAAFPKTREYLLQNGFKISSSDPDLFTLEKVRLQDVAHKLGFSLASLRSVANQSPWSDIRVVEVKNLHFSIESEIRDQDGNVISNSLDNPNALCTVSVFLKQMPKCTCLQTDSPPHFSIRSAVLPIDKLKYWQITFELSATGKKPAAVLQRDLCVSVTRQDQSMNFPLRILFPRGTPEIIAVLPDKPIQFTVDVPPPDNFLSSGKYALHIAVRKCEKPKQPVDYEWVGESYTFDKYKFVIK